MLTVAKATYPNTLFMIRHLLFFWAFCFVITRGHGQTSATSGNSTSLLPQRVPPTPTTAALERYALMPVNEPAGTPTISVSLYEVRCGQLTLPITVSYHAAGIRVADAASWIGLGWSLNAGGVITHIVNGRPDEVMEGFREHPDQIPSGDTLQVPAHYLRNLAFLERISSHQLDYLPDLYTFSLGSQAGTFMQGNDGKYQLLPRQPVHIATVDTAFQLTDAHGVQYFFNSKEYITLVPRASDDRHYISAWYLNRIVSADRADTIRLEYAPYVAETTSIQQQQNFPFAASDSARINVQAPSLLVSHFTQNSTRTLHSGLRLRRILFRTGVVELAASQDRRDTPWEGRLRTLTVLSRDRRDTLKQVRFYQSYFPRVGPDLPPQGPADTTHYTHYALRLDSLQTRTTGQLVPPYRFSYNTSIPLTTAVGGSRDHWGYHNGARPAYVFYNNQSTPKLIPAGTVPNFPRRPVPYPGADRRPNPAFVQAGILTSIRYPTGGGQQFVYEPNTLPGSCLVPNPRTTVRLAATAPDSLGPSTIRQLTFEPFGAVKVDSCLIIINSPGGSTHHGTGSISLQDITNGGASVIGQWNGPNIQTYPSVVLTAGHTYRITINVREASSASFYLQYESAIAVTKPCQVLTGGLRLREERLQANAQAPITYRRYSYTNPATQTGSGYLIRNAPPLYNRVQTTVYTQQPCIGDPNPFCNVTSQVQETVDYLVLSSNPIWDVAGGDRIVGYTCVSVVDSTATGQTLGRTVSYYSGVSDVLPPPAPPVRRYGSYDLGANDVLPQSTPPIPASSNSWRRDQLLTQLIYAQTTATVVAGATQSTGLLRSRLDNTYAEQDMLATRGFNAVSDINISNGIPKEALLQLSLRSYAFSNFYQYSGWKYLTRTRRYLYPPSGDTTSYQLATTTYRYDNPTHQQPTLVETSLSGGQRQQTRTRYAADFDTTQVSGAPALALRELLRTHAVAQLVEQTTTRTGPVEPLVIASSLTLSQVLAPGVVVPAQQLSYRAAAPVNWSSFHPATLMATGRFTQDPGYEPRVVFDRYAANRQPAQSHQPGGAPLCYLWDYRAAEPLAKASGAALTQLAATSFEPGATGRWRYDSTSTSPYLVAGGKTGRWAYRLADARQVACSNLPPGQYMLTYWVKGASPIVYQNSVPVTPTPLRQSPDGWQQYGVTLALAQPSRNSVNLLATPGSAPLLDELRLVPVGAQLTTFTYDPLRGLTSQTDPTGRTTAYEYDGLGRLVRTRDEQGQILSQQQYHYAGAK